MPSHISEPTVSVERTENGYIVHAGSAVATISKTNIGYTVDAGSQILKDEYNLSASVNQARKSARSTAQFSADKEDDTRLIMNTSHIFHHLSKAVEMVCGFIPDGIPGEQMLRLLSVWRNKPDTPAGPAKAEGTAVVTEAAVTNPEKTEHEYSPDVLKIHEMISKLPRYHFDKSTKTGVSDGLLIVFEEGEKYGDNDRIVYVGCNHKAGRLPGIIYGIISGHKDGAVLRKYIGEALLEKEGNPYAQTWKKDSSSPEKRENVGSSYNQKIETETEVRVSSYLMEHMSFSVIEIPDKNRRLSLQKQLISILIEAYSQPHLLTKWLGNYHPDYMIQSAGLWMKGNYLERPFNEDELQTFLKEVQNSQSLKEVTKSIPFSSESISEVTASDEQTPVDDGTYSTEEDVTLDDVFHLNNTEEKEALLLDLVEHHLKELGVQKTRASVLAPLFLYPGVPESKIYHSFWPAYSRTSISGCIEKLIAEKIVSSYRYVRVEQPDVTCYKLNDVKMLISDLNIQKEQKLHVISDTLNSLLTVLEQDYSLPEEHYISHHSEEYTRIQDELINPLTLLGFSQKAAQLLVYLHLFKEVPEEKVHDFIHRLMTPSKKITFLRKLFSSNWISTREEMKKAEGKWVNIQYYRLSQPLEDIVLDYTLNYSERLNNSVKELGKITIYLSKNPLSLSESDYTESDDRETRDDKNNESAAFRSYSWEVNPGISAVKTMDKSAFLYRGSGVPKKVCSFFGADKLPPGERKSINLISNGEKFTGQIVKGSTGSQCVQIYWDQDFADVVAGYVETHGTKLYLAFLKTDNVDTYNLRLQKIGDELERSESKTVVPVPVETKKIPREVESPKPAYASKTPKTPETRTDEIVETAIQRSSYKYLVPTGSLDEWQNLYSTVKPYHAATIQDLGTDFSLFDVSDSRNRTLLGNELMGIINIEGPISSYQLIRRVMEVHSVPRLGEKIEGNINYSLRVLVNQGRIRRSKDGEQEYYSSKLNPIVPRKRNYMLNISFSEISPDEIRGMTISLLLPGKQYVKTMLILGIYRELGYQSQITADISHRIERVLNDMVCDGLVKIENQKVSLVTEKS